MPSDHMEVVFKHFSTILPDRSEWSEGRTPLGDVAVYTDGSQMEARIYCEELTSMSQTLHSETLAINESWSMLKQRQIVDISMHRQREWAAAPIL